MGKKNHQKKDSKQIKRTVLGKKRGGAVESGCHMHNFFREKGRCFKKLDLPVLF